MTLDPFLNVLESKPLSPEPAKQILGYADSESSMPQSGRTHYHRHMTVQSNCLCRPPRLVPWLFSFHDSSHVGSSHDMNPSKENFAVGTFETERGGMCLLKDTSTRPTHNVLCEKPLANICANVDGTSTSPTACQLQRY